MTLIVSIGYVFASMLAGGAIGYLYGLRKGSEN